MKHYVMSLNIKPITFYAHNQVTREMHIVGNWFCKWDVQVGMHFGKKWHLISSEDQTLSKLGCLGNCCICITFFSVKHFSIGIITHYRRPPVYVLCVIVPTCQRTERLCLISLWSNYIPVYCLIACHCEDSRWRPDGKATFLSFMN